MVKKTSAYVDTSAFIAFLDRSDGYHPLFRSLFADPPSLCTSSLVIAEGHGWFLRRYDQRRAVQFLAFVDALPELIVEPFGPEQFSKVSVLVKKYGDHRLTLADAHGLAIMKSRRIKKCWSTDYHLTLTGVPLVTY